MDRDRELIVGIEKDCGLELVANVVESRSEDSIDAADLVILSHGQDMRTTPVLSFPSPNFHTTPTGGRLSSRQI
ncbi:hypothetical protein TNCV_601961 [Trichonephila clavipes]|nr:hypothetical protein TNCV_601961 [Trichonephila clavipes]